MKMSKNCKITIGLLCWLTLVFISTQLITNNFQWDQCTNDSENSSMKLNELEFGNGQHDSGELTTNQTDEENSFMDSNFENRPENQDIENKQVQWSSSGLEEPSMVLQKSTPPYPINYLYPKAAIKATHILGTNPTGTIIEGTYNTAAINGWPGYNEAKVLIGPTDANQNAIRVYQTAVTLKWSAEQKSNTAGDCYIEELVMWNLDQSQVIYFDTTASTYVESIPYDGKTYQLFRQTKCFEFSEAYASQGTINDIRFYISLKYYAHGGSVTIENVQVFYKEINTAPTISEPSLTCSNPLRVGDLLSVSANSADVDENTYNPGHSESIKYQWYQGLSAISGATSSTYTIPLGTSAGLTYSCQVYAIDNLGDTSAIKGSSSVTTVNRAPVITSTSITGDTTIDNIRLINATNILMVTQTAYDNDGHSLTTSYQWKKIHSITFQEENINGATADRYNVSTLDIGYMVYCKITVTDGNGGSDVGSSATIMVANRKPIISNVILPLNNLAYFSDTIQISASIRDPDGVVPNVIVQWYHNASGQWTYFASSLFDYGSGSTSISNLRSFFTQAKVAIYALIYAWDNHPIANETNYITTEAINLINRAPAVIFYPNLIWNITNTPSDAGQISLNLSIATQFFDLDGDTIQITGCEWWKIPLDSTIAIQIPAQNGLSLSGSTLSKGEKIYTKFMITDGYDIISLETAQFTIPNRNPYIQDIQLILNNQTFSCIVNGSDSDRDPLLYEYMWIENGTICATGKNTYLITDYVEGLQYYIQVRAFDGVAYSLWTNSSMVTLLPKLPPATNNSTIINTNDILSNSSTASSTTNNTADSSQSPIIEPQIPPDIMDGNILDSVFHLFDDPIQKTRYLFTAGYGWMFLVVATIMTPVMLRNKKVTPQVLS